MRINFIRNSWLYIPRLFSSVPSNKSPFGSPVALTSSSDGAIGLPFTNSCVVLCTNENCCCVKSFARDGCEIAEGIGSNGVFTVSVSNCVWMGTIGSIFISWTVALLFITDWGAVNGGGWAKGGSWAGAGPRDGIWGMNCTGLFGTIFVDKGGEIMLVGDDGTITLVGDSNAFVSGTVNGIAFSGFCCCSIFVFYKI